MNDKYCRFEPFYTNKVKHLTPPLVPDDSGKYTIHLRIFAAIFGAI